MTDSDTYKDLSKKTEEGTQSFLEGIKQAAAAVSDGAHKATEFVTKGSAAGAHDKGESGGGHGEQTEEDKKREAAHSEAHETAKALAEGKN